jgi:hypothetical protein
MTWPIKHFTADDLGTFHSASLSSKPVSISKSALSVAIWPCRSGSIAHRPVEGWAEAGSLIASWRG